MDEETAAVDRRRFLRGAGAVGASALAAGCSGSSDDEGSSPEENTTPSESDTEPSEENDSDDDGTDSEEEADDEPDVERPSSYRWDLFPERDDELRDELGEYSEVEVGGLIEDHPAFEYSTDSERDDHGIDFNALKLYRESNFDILNERSNNPMEEWVRAFVEEDLYEEEKQEGHFHFTDEESPRRYSTDAWLEADSVEEALDLGHGLVLAIGDPINVYEHAAVMREAFQRHHDMDVLAWETPNQGGTVPSGLMYSPEDDQIRSFDQSPSEHSSESHHFHTPVEEWPFITDGDHHHPLLFHTDEWDRGDVDGFRDAKGLSSTALSNIANDAPTGALTAAYKDEAHEVRGDLAPTTGLTKQLTRTALEYNENDADFQDLWDFANIVQHLQTVEGNHIIDSGIEDDDYEGHFTGELAVYTVDDPSIVDEVWADEAGEYDNFGQNYDELAEVA